MIVKSVHIHQKMILWKFFSLQISEKNRLLQEKDMRIKEKDMQIKEKDAQIGKLLTILSK